MPAVLSASIVHLQQFGKLWDSETEGESLHGIDDYLKTPYLVEHFSPSALALYPLAKETKSGSELCACSAKCAAMSLRKEIAPPGCGLARPRTGFFDAQPAIEDHFSPLVVLHAGSKARS